MCNAILEQGVNKGKQCDRPELQNGFCGKHQKQANDEKNIGNTKCPAKRCNNFLTPDSIEKYCISCLEKKKEEKKNITMCKFISKEKQCDYKSQENGYCGKHQRQTYYDEEKDKGIKYCDIDRGCFVLLNNGKSKCTNCLMKKTESEKTLFNKRSDIHQKMKEDNSAKNTLCVQCGNEFEKFKTANGELSKRCFKCNNYQKISSSRI